ncbi:MAG: protoheme IX farnesyltransferase [Anaerolineae bacterium]
MRERTTYSPQPLLPLPVGWLRTLWAYVELSKPASIALLVFTGLASYVVASRGQMSPKSAALILLAGIAGSAGANATTCYVDRDVDAIMKRTQRRPLPAGRIRPPERALHYGLSMMAIALALAALLGSLAFALMILGLLDNVVVYSLLTKRRSRWNVLWGGISGGVPAAFGWSVATGSLNLTAVLMAALVVLWIPNHIICCSYSWA